MIDRVLINNMGPLKHMCWDDLGRINVIVGENRTGKTIALKALFVALKSLQEQGLGNDNRLLRDILSDKLYWTFQPGDMGLGALVNNSNEGVLSFSMSEGEEKFEYSFGKDTKKMVNKVENDFATPQNNNVVFIPASEVISKYQIILKSREQDRIFGYDETEYSLVKTMQFPSSNEKGKVSDDAVSKLREFDGGTLDYNKQENVWKFVSGKTEIPIGIVSEGVRKMSVIERLLDVNYIKPGSIVIIDEIENSLHPKALCDFIDIVYQLSCNDIQFFISTHSYIAMKKFYVMAREEDISIPTVSLEDGAAICADLKDGLPENGIIKYSNEIYEREVDLMFR